MALPESKTKDPTPTDENPWNDDVLERDKFGRILEEFIVSQQGPLSIAIDGKWGTGKTFFAERWEQQLAKDGFKVIHYNAWEDDYVVDPMPSIIGRLWSDLGLTKDKTALTGELGRDLKTMLSFAGRVAKGFAVHIAQKKLEAWTGLDKDAQKAIVGNDESEAGEILKEFEDSGKAKEVFREALCRLVQRTVGRGDAATTPKPLVFVVDELDRCRPSFAVQVLERIKHFLSVPHVVFVFCVDREQLAHSLKAVYGSIDTDNYLHRFFDFEFRLPAADSSTFCKMLWRTHGLNEFLIGLDGGDKGIVDSWKNRSARVLDMFAMLATIHNLSLREIEFSFRSFHFLVRSFNKRLRLFQPELIASYLFLRLRHRNLCGPFIQMECPPAIIIDALMPKKPPISILHLAERVIRAVFEYMARRDPAIDFVSPQYQQASEFLQWVKTRIGTTSMIDNSAVEQENYPTCVPKSLRSWTNIEICDIARNTPNLGDEIKQSFLEGNPLERYDSILNLVPMTLFPS